MPAQSGGSSGCSQGHHAKSGHANRQTKFRTGGGIQPDYVVHPPAMNGLRMALDTSASFTKFATEYLHKNKIDDDFEVTGKLLDEFQSFLAARGIQPGIKEWSAEHDFVVNRLKTELFNQAFCVAKGDQVEAQRDPVILKALELVGN